jgi:hypothetical protein
LAGFNKIGPLKREVYLALEGIAETPEPVNDPRGTVLLARSSECLVA